MTNRVGEVWESLTKREIFLVVDPPKKESHRSGFVVAGHGMISLHDGRRMCWYEYPNRSWGTVASHMRRVT